MSDEKGLRESLLNAEPFSPERQARFREELARIREPRLPRSHRLYYLLALLGSIGGAFGAACSLATDAGHRGAWAAMLVVWAASAGWVFHILRRGAEPLRAMQGMSKVGAGLGVLAAWGLIGYGLSDPSLTNVLLALGGLSILLLTSFINLWNRVILGERAVREDVLRVEYRLADLAARLPPAAKP